jgi:hypothetical protein
MRKILLLFEFEPPFNNLFIFYNIYSIITYVCKTLHLLATQAYDELSSIQN